MITPNHLHGIIVITKPGVQRMDRPNGKNKFMSKISPKSGTLSTII